MTRRRWLTLLAGATVVAGLIVFVGDAFARPGGGSTYSGGGGGGGRGGGGGDSGGLFQLLIWLAIEKPYIGVPLLIIVTLLWLYGKRSKGELSDWDTAPPVHTGPPPDLEKLHELDPDFSIVLFDDFVYRLYATVHGARGTPDAMDALAPYVSAAAREAMLAREPTGVPVSNVVVGAMRPISLVLPPTQLTPEGEPNFVNIGLEFEANVTTGAAGEQRTWYLVERWELSRAANAVSKPPGASERFPCPNCGAPFESSDNQRCEYCNEIVNNGRFDWLVTSVELVHSKDGPPTLTGTVEERGTDLPTRTHPAVDRRWASLVRDDPAMTQEAIGARVVLIYDQLNIGWTALDLSVARPFISDGMYDSMQYWIDAYRNQGLRNVLEGQRIYHWAYARITRDKYYDSLTVRIWGTGKDFTVDKAGKLVGGSNSREREYTEYWTLIRSAQRRGEARADKACPSCGAELKISMAGTCEFCGTHITSGEFDWVLSKIEQDDSYRG